MSKVRCTICGEVVQEAERLDHLIAHSPAYGAAENADVTASMFVVVDECECELPGYFNSGLPGVLAHVENGKVTSKVERCDTCLRYASDREAAVALRRHLRRQRQGGKS
jgi:phage FluMu protein Com